MTSAMFSPGNSENGAEVILELLRTNGIDCVFASPLATMAPLWKALAARECRCAGNCAHANLGQVAKGTASGVFRGARDACRLTGRKDDGYQFCKS
ncbi:MAG: hypothetical protein DME76_14155 [Verrucomicrobia bacterium]|nr:MAG: hypothetical protein DME76_14155 [Verrucomicrobiota bacterium]